VDPLRLVGLVGLVFWAIFGWAGISSADSKVNIASQTEPAELVDALIKFESAYFGRTVTTNWSKYIYGESDHQIWISDDGQVQVFEYEITHQRTDQDGKTSTVLQRGGYHNNADFSLQASQRITDGIPDSVSLNAVPERFPRGLATGYHPVLFGYSPVDYQRFSEICGDRLAMLDVATFSFQGEELVGLNCRVPGKGEYTFGFIPSNGEFQFRYFQVSKQIGDSFAAPEGVFRIGAINLPDSLVPAWGDVTHVNHIWYPIVHDGRFPIRVTFWNVAEERPGDVAEVLSHAESDRDLRADRIEFTNIELPDGEPKVQVYRSGVPTILKNGQLVSLIDGAAIDQMKGVGFRQPQWIGSWSFYVLVTGIVCVLVAVSCKCWTLRKGHR